jgi:hypothetical protein
VADSVYWGVLGVSALWALKAINGGENMGVQHLGEGQVSKKSKAKRAKKEARRLSGKTLVGKGGKV